MGEAKRRGELGSLVSVLIPERGRPEMLDRTISSLIDTAGDDDGFEILVQIDDDDPAWRDRAGFDHVHTRYMRRPRPPTLGEKLNGMAAESRGGLILWLANDQVMETRNWPEKCREAAAKMPGGMGIGYLQDPGEPGLATYWMMTRAMVERVGFFAAPWPPYWFIDTWWTEIGMMADLLIPIGASVSAPDGRGGTHGKVDLDFWVDWFIGMRPQRVRDALHLTAMAWGEDSQQMDGVVRKLAETQAACVSLTEHMRSREFLDRWGGEAESEPGPDYWWVKENAAKQVAQVRSQRPRSPKVIVCVPSGQVMTASTANAVAALCAYSSARGVDINLLNSQASSVTHVRNMTVEIALEQGADLLMWIDSDMDFPPDMLVRLMAHRKPIVGCVYNRRVPPYGTLGQLKGEKPEVMHDGLHEANLLPGGIMLVSAEVYRALRYPFYAETYMWAGNGGLEKLKNMLRAVFTECPSEEMLAELDTTAFGAWMGKNFKLGENGEEFKYFSEDLFFCRQARRAGFEIWCDIGLSHEISHWGALKVTTLKPDPAHPPAEVGRS